MDKNEIEYDDKHKPEVIFEKDSYDTEENPDWSGGYCRTEDINEIR